MKNWRVMGQRGGEKESRHNEKNIKKREIEDQKWRQKSKRKGQRDETNKRKENKKRERQ